MGDLFIKAYQEGGLILLLVVALCIITYRIIMHILKTNDKTLQMAMDAQEKWQKAIDGTTAAIAQIREETKSAHGYQREEHLKIVDNQMKITQHLAVMNENAEKRGDVLGKICDNLDEQGKVLTRINGEKH